MRVGRLLAAGLVAVTTFVPVPHDRALAQTPPQALAGTWEIGIEPGKEPRKVVGYFLFPGCRKGSGGTAFTADGKHPGGGSEVNGNFAGGVFKGGTLTQLTPKPNPWQEQFEVRRSPDGATATGTWNNGYGTFKTSWRRLLPQGVRIERVTQTKDTARLEVTGSKLFHYDRASFAGCGSVFVEGAGMTVTAVRTDPEAEKVSIDVAVKPGTPAGPRVLWFEGVRLPWDWRGDGTLAQAPAVAELRFVRAAGDRFEAIADEIRFGERFHVEARFSSAPADSQRRVKLDWGGGAAPMEVELKPTETERLLRSGPLYLEAPPPAAGPTPTR
jgi:hypothetical protein